MTDIGASLDPEEPSYLLGAGLTDTGEHLDDETVSEILGLAATQYTPLESQPDITSLVSDLDQQQQSLDTEVKTRNARYYDQQEEIYYRNIEDRRAESDAKIRDYEKKAREARRNAKHAEDPVEQLRLKREARTWQRKADDEADRFRADRHELEDKQDEYMELIKQALTGSHQREPLFTIRWQVTP